MVYKKNCSNSNHELLGRRQVVDIPPIQPIITEHRIYSTVCTCGKTNGSSYPKEAAEQVSYGNSIQAAIGYLSVGQYMSMDRIAELFKQVFNIKFSQGTISNKLASLTKQCLPIYEQIRSRIESSPVIGTDETGCVVNSKIPNVLISPHLKVEDIKQYKITFPTGFQMQFLLVIVGQHN